MKKLSKRIVIIPTFASSHFLKCWIPNIQEILEPDYILIRESLFPDGPENKGHIDDEFKKKWCYPNTNAGFDWEETRSICSQYGNVVLDWFTPKTSDSNKCFIEAISLNLDKYADVGDCIFVLEPDVFIHQNDKQKINDILEELEIGSGHRIKWIDFLGTQFYTESVNIQSPKVRRFVYRFDNIKNFLNAHDGYMSQNYPKLKQIDDFFLFHYPWFVYDGWKELRYELIWRKDEKYWKDFEIGLQEIAMESIQYCFDHLLVKSPKNKILIRPSRQDEGRWASFIDVPHPRHIMNHPNFVK